MCKQVRIVEDKLWGAFVKVAEPGRPTQTVKAEEASWRRISEISQKTLGRVFLEEGLA